MVLPIVSTLTIPKRTFSEKINLLKKRAARIQL